MPVFTVHAPVSSGADLRARPEKIRFVRDGFHFWAFVFGPFWFIWHRLWLALLGYVIVMAAVGFAFRALAVDSGTRLLVLIVIALLVGFEASSLRRWTLSRRKWRQVDTVVADCREAAEQRFFDRRTNGASPDRSGSSLPPMPRASLSQQEVIGLFPQPGAPR